ncbi:MAG: DsbA family protein [Sulfitobacter sp.]|nr:DsbA family protein [Sulfitobacter sp.]
MNRRNVILGGVALLGLGGWALTSGFGGGIGSTPVNPLASAANAQSSDADTSMIKEMVAGNPDAAVEVIEYASFTCPHCARFHEGPFKQLKADYIDTGKIRFVYREVYFDRFGLWASMIARCGGEERFFGIADLFYKTQAEWTRAGDPGEIANELRKVGRLAGIETEALEACLQDAEKAQALVAWDEANRTADGVDSTPSFVINGQKYTNMPYAEMKDILDAALQG